MLGMTIICFVISTSPGDPAIISPGQDATPAQVEEVREAYGLDSRLRAVRALALARRAVEFGRSFISKVPAPGLILERSRQPWSWPSPPSCWP